ncbi:MAG: dTMP kinase [Polynucleobacter sp.]|jgi:dTMP kinase|nr:dTMP kinase [Polynucleobacter sp.]
MSANKPGFFISFEGIDGAGKSTHLERFAAWVKSQYPERELIMTREPGGTTLGEQLRGMLLNTPMHLETEALLMFAARREHLAAVIEPALAKGHIVVSDRFTDASFAYQGGGRGLSLDKLDALEKWVQGRGNDVIEPDLTILFDLPGTVAESRRSQARAPDKFEQMDLDFFERVRQEYLRRAKADPTRFVIMNADQSPDLIWAQLQAIQLSI